MFDLMKQEKILKKVFYVSSTFILLIMLFISKDYGMNWDEGGFGLYGDNIVKFYSSFGHDISYSSDSRYQQDIVYYGGFFEVIVWCLIKISGLQPHLVRHALTAVFGFLAILFTGLLAKELANWKTGILASFLLFVTPFFLGNSMHNFKDIPFAASYILSIYYLVRSLKELPRCTHKTSIFLMLSVGLSINLRVGGIILLPYLLLFWLIKIGYIHLFKGFVDNGSLENQPQNDLVTVPIIKNCFLQVALICVGAYILGILFWPYALSHPFTGVMEALKQLSNVQYWNGYPLFKGQWFNSWQVPWDYVPTWILITSPLFVLVAFIGLFVTFFKKAWSKEELLHLLMILFVTFFPVFYVIFRQSNLYDSWRHLYFVYPPLIVVSAVVIGKWVSSSSQISKVVISVLLGIFILEPILFMVNNYPNIAFYFSPLIGGVKGAFKNYEMDYYGTSLRSAVDWVANDPEINKSGNKIRIKCWYGGGSSIEPFVKSYKNLELNFEPDNSPNWDYLLVPTIQAKQNHDILKNWPPGNTVHEVKVDEVPLVAILKNTITKDNKTTNIENLLATLKQPPTNATADTFINLSLQLINGGDNCNAIIALEKALDIEPKHTIALNNLCIAYSNLSLFDEALEACKEAVKLNPQYQLAVNNQNFALSKKDKANKDTQINNLINLCLTYCNYGKYEKAVITAKKAISINPKNSIAYNNLCVAYNGLQEWDKAIDAAEKALVLDPGFTLAKNNLEWAKSQKNK